MSNASRGNKILRACVVQGGKVIEEQRLRKREPLTIGTGAKNTFVISGDAAGRSHQLFAVKGGAYELILTEEMHGKISVGANPMDVDALKSQGLLKQRGSNFVLPLNDKHRGKVAIGDITVIFQFVSPPPVPAKPVLPQAARGGLIQAIDWPFAYALVAAFMLEAPLIGYFSVVPPPEPVSLDTISNRWAKLIVPERKKEKKKPKVKKKDGEKKKVAKKEPVKEKDDRSREEKRKAPTARSKKIRDSIASKGLLAILGTTGSGAGDAVADVFGEGGIDGDLDSAFEGISGVGIAKGGKSSRGGGSGDAASIGGLATSGGGKVGLGNKQEKRVGKVETAAPEVDGSLDSDAIVKVIKSRIRMVRDCYERELKRDGGLSGRIEVEFTIGSNGRIEDAEVVDNSMNSDAVGSCILSRLKRWRFPKPDGGSVTVAYPFIFTPSS